MASVFGYQLGVIGVNGGNNPNGDNTDAVDQSDFMIGSDILLFSGIKNGTTLKNRSGDSWTFNNVFEDAGKTNIFCNDNVFVINGNTYKYDRNLWLCRIGNSPNGTQWLMGSYMFTATNAHGNLVTGRPTRAYIDEKEPTNNIISPSDTSGGVIQYIDGKPMYFSVNDELPIDDSSIKSSVWNGFALFLAREITFDPADLDPYKPGGNSGTGGGSGDFSGTGDNIEIPSLPTLSAVDTGFITLFNPSIQQLYALANYMWSDLFDLNAWRKIFADPMDAILGLSLVPVNVPAGGTASVTVGNITTGVSMTKAASQFVTVDCGTLNVKEYWGAYLDYDPYTKAEIYLPYIGTHALAVDDIMNKSVHVVYHVDILSGACCAYVKCGGSVLYTFVGQCSCSIPITGNDWTNVINGALSIATAIGSMVATGGASAPLAVSSVASTAINSMKPNVEKSGSLGGMGGMMGVQTPYLILTRPRQALPKYQNKYMGYPSFITSKLSKLSGYTEIESIHLDNIPATEQELTEIETLLKGGVIL